MNECNFDTGTRHAVRNVEYLQDVMKSIGLEPERLQMHYCSAAEGQKFQTTVKKMTHELEKLGPSPLKKLASEKKKSKK